MLAKPTVVVALLAAVGCHRGKEAPAVPAAAEAPVAKPLAPRTHSGYRMAGLEVDATVVVQAHAPGGQRPERWQAKLEIDGHVTEAQWPEYPPKVLAVGDGRYVVYDSYNENRIYVWEPDTKRLTDLGRGGLVQVPGQGYLVATYSDAGLITYAEIAADAPTLRAIWQQATPSQRVVVAGVYRGAIALLVDNAELVLLVRGEPPRRKRIELGGRVVASGDAIRGDRLLLVDRRAPAANNTSSNAQVWPMFGPWASTVSIYNVRTGKRRDIGRATGDYTRYTAVPHPYLTVGWGASTTTQGTLLGDDHCTNWVDEDTEAIATVGC